MLYLGADHAGFRMKEKLKKFLSEKKIAFHDCGAHEINRNDDYPEFAQAVARAVSAKKTHRGILLCGSGQGMCIAANKLNGARAALAWNTKSARLSRTDDDANILCLPARLISERDMRAIVTTWLTTEFSKEQRHRRRIRKIEKIA